MIQRFYLTDTIADPRKLFVKHSQFMALTRTELPVYIRHYDQPMAQCYRMQYFDLEPLQQRQLPAFFIKGYPDIKKIHQLRRDPFLFFTLDKTSRYEYIVNYIQGIKKLGISGNN